MNRLRASSLLTFYVSVFFLVLYVPIIVLVIFSFNSSAYTHAWSGFSLQWYFQLFEHVQAWQALKNSLIIAFCSVLLTITMAVAVVSYGAQKIQKFFVLFYGSLLVPEIVLSVGLLGFFSLLSVPLGFITLVAGHTLLGLGYSVPIIQARYSELEKHLTEASLDLGATKTQTFFLIIFPLLAPALCSAALLTFVISLDDFLIAFFCSSPQTQTLPLYIFSEIRSGGSALVNALSTMLLLIGAVAILFITFFQVRKGISIRQ